MAFDAVRLSDFLKNFCRNEARLIEVNELFQHHHELIT